MTKAYDGGQAFPRPGDTYSGASGMSLRDWFAGQIIAGLMANHRADHDVKETGKALADMFAKVAYMQADAMIRERSK